MDAFEHDMTFSRDGLQAFFHQCVADFSVADNGHPAISTRLGPFARDSSMLRQSQSVWAMCQRYLQSCFHELRPAHDHDLQTLFERIQRLPFRLATHSLQDTLLHVLYMSIFLHDIYGDGLRPLADASMVWVPTLSHQERSESSRQQLVSKFVFQFVFFEATIKTYELRRSEWIRYLPRRFQSHARLFQREAIGINPQFELGINK
jgi:hypothetical protein